MSTEMLQTHGRENLKLSRPATPRVDVFENAEEIVVLVDLPGVAKDDLDVRVEKDTLTLSAKVAPRAKPEWRKLSVELTTTAYERAFTLPEGTDVDRISVELASGVATLHLPKAERAKPRTIKVR